MYGHPFGLYMLPDLHCIHICRGMVEKSLCSNKGESILQVKTRKKLNLWAPMLYFILVFYCYNPLAILMQTCFCKAMFWLL